MPSIADDVKKDRTKFDAAAKKRKDVDDLVAAVKKMGDVEKAAKAWDKAYTSDDAEGVRKETAELTNAIKIQNARVVAVVMKLKKAQNEDAMELGQDIVAGLMNAGQTAAHYADTLLAKGKHAATAAKMKPTVFSGDWIGAKKDFEAKIGKKKPSKRFLGVVRVSSGLEAATKSLDAASKGNDPAAFAKGLTAYKAAAAKYWDTVVSEAKVAVDDTDTDIAPESVDPFDYKEAAKDLLRTLNQIRQQAEQVLAGTK